MHDIEILNILDEMKIVESLYEVIRVVDPTEKKVLHLVDNKVEIIDSHCFDFWQRNSLCNNCISIRAYNENKIFFKLEYVAGKIYMITAVPVELEDSTVVIELLKNVTSSMIISDSDSCESIELYQIIDRINQIALKDILTDVYNRRYIDERLPMDITSCAFYNSHISVIMADIDYFKNVNDAYGHINGDCALKAFASILQNTVKREKDWVARYGGEEFLICLPDTDQKGAEYVAEKMRKATENKTILYNGGEIKITASFGVFSKKCKINTKPRDLISAADKNLYKAKSKGRNRVEP